MVGYIITKSQVMYMCEEEKRHYIPHIDLDLHVLYGDIQIITTITS